MIREQGDEAVEWLTKKLEVTNSPETQLIKVALMGPDIEQPKKVVDAILTTYVEQIVHAERQEGLQMKQLLERELMAKTTDYDNKQNAFNKLAANTLAVADDESTELAQRLEITELSDLSRKKWELDSLREFIDEAEKRVRTLKVNLDQRPRASVLQYAEASESTNWKFKWIQITAACVFVFSLTAVGMASRDYQGKLTLALTVIYLLSLALTWTLFGLGMLEIEDPTIEEYFVMFLGPDGHGPSVLVALYWTGVWTVGYILALVAAALLKYNLNPGWNIR